MIPISNLTINDLSNVIEEMFPIAIYIDGNLIWRDAVDITNVAESDIESMILKNK